MARERLFSQLVSQSQQQKLSVLSAARAQRPRFHLPSCMNQTPIKLHPDTNQLQSLIFDMKPSNRKPIPLHRPTNSMEAKRSILSTFEPDLNQDIQSYLTLQREKLRLLDKAAAKKIISTAERSLMNFMRSKAKVNCFQKKNHQYHPYSTMTSKCFASPQKIFDPKKLEAELEKEQRRNRPAGNENNPLIEYSMRQVQSAQGLRKSRDGWDRVVRHKDEVYCGYSSKKKSNKIIYY